MTKTQIVLWIEEDLKRLLKVRYDNVSKKFSEVMKTILEVEEKEYDQEDTTKIETEIALLKSKLEDIKYQKDQQKIDTYHQKIQQEKRNMPLIEDKFMKLIATWDEFTAQKFHKEWQDYLKDNNMMINDLNKMQYWFRFYESEGKTYE
jgi:hypothetical protein